MTQYGHKPINDGASARSQPSPMDLTVGDYANGMPTIRIGEMFKSFGRQLTWMIPMLIIGTAFAWFGTKNIKRTYAGEGRILVQLGSEYVYESVTNNAQSSGLMLTPDHIVLNEIGLMKNTDIIARVTGELRDEFGERRLAKAQYEKIKSSGNDPIAKKNAIVDLYKFIDTRYVVVPKPKSSIVDLVFKHEDPDIAVRGMNLFINAYMDARKDIFVEGSSDIITERRVATEVQLDSNEAAIQKFLRDNRISDFTSEQTGAQERTEELRAALNLLRANMSETETALVTVETQLRNTPEQINLFVDDRASQRVAQTELELQQLLAKYLPNSNPVRQKREELRLLKTVSSTGAGQASGGRRVGPNTVYQGLLTRRNTLQATADSFREREFTLQRQLNAADAKVKKLTRLQPTYDNLLRERGTLDTRLRNYTTKEQEALINQQQAQADSENVRVISISDLPRKGRNMRMIMFAVAFVAWGFTVFMLGLLRVFLDPRLYATSASGGTETPRVIQRRRSDYIPEAVTEYRPGSVPTSNPVPQQVPGSANMPVANSVAASVPTYAHYNATHPESSGFQESSGFDVARHDHAYGTNQAQFNMQTSQPYSDSTYSAQTYVNEALNTSTLAYETRTQNDGTPPNSASNHAPQTDGNAAYDYNAVQNTNAEYNPYLDPASTAAETMQNNGQGVAYPNPLQNSGYLPSNEDG